MHATDFMRTKAVRQNISRSSRKFLTTACAALLGLCVAADNVRADSNLLDNDEMTTNERYEPGIWIDPDGCEHWVMDDGFEGYMTPHVNRKGIPVCHRMNMCGVMNTDQFFSTNSSRISAAGQGRLKKFFNDAEATSFIIVGHTDSRASDAYNMRLSYRRASAVAKVAQASGAKIADVRGMGERVPVASNRTAGGMAKNRRVEIICVR